MKETIMTLLFFIVLASCSYNIKEKNNYNINEKLEHLQSFDYEQFKGMTLTCRFGMFRGVVGEIDGIPFAVGTTGLKKEIINDAKSYPLPDSLRNSKDMHLEIKKRRLPLSRSELNLIHEFIEIGILKLSVDSTGNISGKLSPQIDFKRPMSHELDKKLEDEGYEYFANGFYIKEYRDE